MLKKYEELIRVGFCVVTGAIIGFTLVGCSIEAENVKEASTTAEVVIESSVTNEVMETLEEVGGVETLEDEYTYVPSFTEEEAMEFISAYKNVTSAHIEVYNTETYDIEYYTLTDEQVDKVKSMLESATVDITQNSGDADFTTTLHMFNEDESYAYVVALQADKKTMFVEPGGLICENLADYMDVLSVNAEFPKEE